MRVAGQGTAPKRERIERICDIFFIDCRFGLSPHDCAASSLQDKQVVGWLEEVKIYPGNLILKAKLDTGAKNCSLNAQNIVEFERDGEKWVRFEIVRHSGDYVTWRAKCCDWQKSKCGKGSLKNVSSFPLEFAWEVCLRKPRLI
jgi:hypothetical protein